MKEVWILVGPTASGKSARALDLAQKIDGEIISCDSMQIYRECDIVTAKPSPSELQLVPHHLIDICDPSERFSAARWAHEASQIIREIQTRDKTPIICGGTGFYLRALLEPERVSAPEPDENLRAELELHLQREGAASLRAQLAKLEPEIEAHLAEGDAYRLIRALQIAMQRQRGDQPLPAPVVEGNLRIFALDWPREELYARINARVDTMLEMGALAELGNLREKWGIEAPALGGVGYKQLAPVLEEPARLKECVEIWKQDTRRYAKRQLTWFRHQLSAVWLGPEDELEI